MTRPATQAQFAATVGVTQPAIGVLVRRGTLKRGAPAGEWLKDYCENLRVQAGRTDGEDLSRERARLAREQADRVAMQNERERGQYFHIDAVRKHWINLSTSVRSRVLAIPRKLAPILARANTPEECEQIVETEVHEALTEIADGGVPK